MRRRLGGYSISPDVLDTEGLCGVFRRRGPCARRATVNSFGAEALFGAFVCTQIGRGGSAEQQLWPI